MDWCMQMQMRMLESKQLEIVSRLSSRSFLELLSEYEDWGVF